MRKVLGWAAGFATCFAVTSSFAAGPFFVGFEANFVKPSGMPSAFAISDPDFDGDPDGSIVAGEFSNEIAPEIYFGWMTGSGGYVYFDFWQFDETEQTSVTNPTGGSLWDSIYPADGAFDDYEGTALSDLTIDAQKIDFVYGRNVIETDKFNLAWMGGLRYATLDYNHTVLYEDIFLENQTVTLISETDGIGIVGGVKGQVKFNENVSLNGGARYAFLTGGSDQSTFALNPLDIDPDADVRGSLDQSWTMLEGNCVLVFKISDSFWLHAGLEFEQWNNVVNTTLFPSNEDDGSFTRDAEDVNFDGFIFGATLAWGGDK